MKSQETVVNLARWLSGEPGKEATRPTDQCVTPMRLAKLSESPWTEAENVHIRECAYCLRRIGGMYRTTCPDRATLQSFALDSSRLPIADAVKFHLNETVCSDCQRTVNTIQAAASRGLLAWFEKQSGVLLNAAQCAINELTGKLKVGPAVAFSQSIALRVSHADQDAGLPEYVASLDTPTVFAAVLVDAVRETVNLEVTWLEPVEQKTLEVVVATEHQAKTLVLNLTRKTKGGLAGSAVIGPTGEWINSARAIAVVLQQ